MKHTIELKFPKVFKRKKKSDPDSESPDIKTEIDLKEVTAEIDLDKLKDNAIKIGIPVAIGVAGITYGYMMGYKAGVNKVLDKTTVFDDWRNY